MIEKLTWRELGVDEHPLLSPAYAVDKFVFASGSVGAEEDGSFSKSVERQTELAIQALEKVLKATGSSLEQVIKVLLFVRNPEDAAKVNEVYGKYMKTKPARSCIAVIFPNPDILVELECVAVRNIKSKF